MKEDEFELFKKQFEEVKELTDNNFESIETEKLLEIPEHLIEEGPLENILAETK